MNGPAGIPKQLLYLSAHKQKSEAVYYQVGRHPKRTVIATTYEEAGLEVHPRMREEVVRNGLPEGKIEEKEETLLRSKAVA